MEEFIDTLKLKKYRITKFRKIIAEIFLEKENEHLLIEDIIKIYEKKEGPINIASLYNTLNIFVKEKLINQYNFANKKYFELNYTIHGHFFCNNCLEMININIPGLDCLDVLIYKKYQKKITSHKIEFYGECEKCQKSGEINGN